MNIFHKHSKWGIRRMGNTRSDFKEFLTSIDMLLGMLVEINVKKIRSSHLYIL